MDPGSEGSATVSIHLFIYLFPSHSCRGREKGAMKGSSVYRREVSIDTTPAQKMTGLGSGAVFFRETPD